MRAVLVSVLGAVLAVSAASADPLIGCKLDGLELVAEADRPDEPDYWHERPPKHIRFDLVGKTFRVTKVASTFWRIQGGPPGDLRDDGTIYAIVVVGSERFLIKQVHNRNAGPQEMGYSFPADDPLAQSIRWNQRSASAERTRFGYFNLTDGPLEGLILKPKNCTVANH